MRRERERRRGSERQARGTGDERDETKKRSISPTSLLILLPYRTLPVYAAALFPPDTGTMTGAIVDLEGREKGKERGKGGKRGKMYVEEFFCSDFVRFSTKVVIFRFFFIRLARGKTLPRFSPFFTTPFGCAIQLFRALDAKAARRISFSARSLVARSCSGASFLSCSPRGSARWGPTRRASQAKRMAFFLSLVLPRCRSNRSLFQPLAMLNSDHYPGLLRSRAKKAPKRAAKSRTTRASIWAGLLFLPSCSRPRAKRKSRPHLPLPRFPALSRASDFSASLRAA